MQEITQALLTTRLKSPKDISYITKSSVDMLYPGTTAPTAVMTNKDTAARDLFRLDLAYLMLTRDENFGTCILKFAWADSSPQGPYDWLLWKHRCVKARDLLTVAKAVSDLIRMPGGVLGGECGPDVEVPLGTDDLRHAANQLLASMIFEHVCVRRFVVRVLLFVGCTTFCLFRLSNKKTSGTGHDGAGPHRRKRQSELCLAYV